jgi:general secretion pathway protein L
MTVEPEPLQVESWQEAAAFILRNWREEIAALWQGWRGRARETGRDLLWLQASPREVVARFGMHEIGRFENSTAGASALAGHLESAEGRRAMASDAVIQFEEAAVLRTRTRLPRTARAALRGALEFELDRLSPIPAAELYFDFQADKPGHGADRIELASRAVRRRAVDQAIAFAHQAELAVAGIALGDDAELGDWRHFPVDRAAWLRGLWRRWGSAGLAAIGVLLMLAILFAVSARAAAQADALDERIAVAQVRASGVARLERAMTAIRGQAAIVAARKSQPSLVAILSALSDALPDGTWLTGIQYDAGKLHIQGYSHAAAALIGKLDRSGRFANAQFIAPLVRNDSDGTDRFDLTVKAVGVP